MKKLIALLLSVALALSLTACAAKPEETQPQATEETEPAVMLDPVDDNYRTFYQIFVGSPYLRWCGLP